MRVTFYWEQPGGSLDDPEVNPYARLLARALAKHDVFLEPGGQLTPAALWRERHRMDALHFNWPSRQYADRRWLVATRRLLNFVVSVAWARLLGYRIVWTMHNLYPHERPFPLYDHLARLAICALAHAVIVHCPHARDLLAQHFGRRRHVHVIPHGHFLDIYPDTISPTEARARLHLPEDCFVYLFFGNIRAYKGVERLLNVFTSLDDPNIRLVVAGRLYSGRYNPLSAAVQRDDRVLAVVGPTLIPIKEVQLYVRASDVVVLPYSTALTSGAAILALGFGKPVIAPAVGCLPELLQGHGCAITYPPGPTDGLRNALIAAQALDVPRASRNARQRACDLDWDRIATMTLPAYGLG